MRPRLDTVSRVEEGIPRGGVGAQDRQGDAGGAGLVPLGEKRAEGVVDAIPNYLKGGWREDTAQRSPVKG